MISIALTVNGLRHEAEVEPRQLLVYFLREQLGLTGTNVGCDTTTCGACTVLLEGRSVKSCALLALQADGREVTTIEGLAQRPEFARLEDAFSRHAALQCGFCTPGMLLTVSSLLEHGELSADEEEIKQRLDGNICRCTGYRGIVEAVADLAAG